MEYVKASVLGSKMGELSSRNSPMKDKCSTVAYTPKQISQPPQKTLEMKFPSDVISVTLRTT